MIKYLLILGLACYLAFAPGAKTEFVLDDYYTVARNPLIKQPALYPKIFTSHLFDANPSSGYMKLSYYRPVLQSSYILDYLQFKLNPTGYQWSNWIIHVLNAWLVFFLVFLLFSNTWLAFLTALIFAVTPSHEWVVRYITGRGDSLQTLLGLISLLSFTIFLQGKRMVNLAVSLVTMFLSILSREFGYLLPLYMGLIAYIYPQRKSKIIRFSLGWVMIGSLSLIVTLRLLPKLGPIQALHFWYFTSIGFCLGISYLLLRFSWGKWAGIAVSVVLGLLSFSQQSYWENEKKLLIYTHQYEGRPYTVAHQQLLMKYEDNPKAVMELIQKEEHPILKSMWLWRLGQLEMIHQNWSQASEYMDQALKYNPSNVDALNARGIIFLEAKEDSQGLALLQEAYRINPSYTPTLQNLGVYYLSHSNQREAAKFFQQARYLEGFKP